MVWGKAGWETGLCALRMNETTVSVRMALELQVFATTALVQLRNKADFNAINLSFSIRFKADSWVFAVA